MTLTSDIPFNPGEEPVAQPGVKRRDFLFIATGAFAGIGTLFMAWPFIDQMNPAADVLAASAPIDIDLSKILPGQQIVIVWQSKPVFIVHRTPAILAKLKSQAVLSRLRDPQSETRQQPPYASNWCRSIKPDYLVLVGICTHLGCIPEFHPQAGEAALGANWPGGYFCPCHGSRYDLAGRVFQGVPAPLNLPVPPHHFANDTTLVIGENPKGQTFDLGSVEQL